MKARTVSLKVMCSHCGKPTRIKTLSPVALRLLPRDVRCARCDRMNVGFHGLNPAPLEAWARGADITSWVKGSTQL